MTSQANCLIALTICIVLCGFLLLFCCCCCCCIRSPSLSLFLSVVVRFVVAVKQLLTKSCQQAGNCSSLSVSLYFPPSLSLALYIYILYVSLYLCVSLFASLWRLSLCLTTFYGSWHQLQLEPTRAVRSLLIILGTEELRSSIFYIIYRRIIFLIYIYIYMHIYISSLRIIQSYSQCII